MSLVLRHEPQKIGVKRLEPGGFVGVDQLLAGLARNGFQVTLTDLERIGRESDKQRFSFDESGKRIRCNQGHSVPVDLELEAAVPPEILYHGTVAVALEAIRKDGLHKMKRHAVHLSLDHETATKVGSGRGKPIILAIRASEMQQAGHVFYRSENGVWLVDEVPPSFIDF